MINEIKYPANRNFWTAEENGEVLHSGVTEPNQVTSTAHDLTGSEDAGDVFPELPESGLLKEGDVYAYQGGMVRIEQDHERTIYPPQLTPALITFVRKETGDLEWMMNESIEIGDVRVYDGVKYEAITAHTSLENWTPDQTPTLWKVIQQGEEIGVWVQPTGGHDAYNIGDRVHFPTENDPVYESLINANVWSPTVYPAGWSLIE